MTPLRRHVWMRRALVGLIVPILFLATVTPARAFFDPTGPVQRALMIINQITTIGHQVTMIRELGNSVTNLENQLQQMRDEALGRVGFLADAFDQLSSDPASLFADGPLPWAEDFGGDALPYVQALANMGSPGNALTNQWRQQLANADVIGVTDIQGLFSDPILGFEAAEGWQAQRDVSDRQRVFDYATFDAAERLTEILASAEVSLAAVRGQTNLSPTALQQAQVATQLTSGEIAVAQAQLAAYSEIRDALERQSDELIRRRDLERWVAAERAARAGVAAAQAANAARSQGYRDALLLPEMHGRGN